MKTLKRFLEILMQVTEKIGRLSIGIACLEIGFLTILVFASSISRYAVGRAIGFTDELVGLLFLSAAILTLTYGFYENKLIRLEVVFAKLPPRWKTGLDGLGLIASAAVFFVIALATLGFAMDCLEYGSRTTATNILLWPWALTIPFSLALVSVSMGLTGIYRFIELSESNQEEQNV